MRLVTKHNELFTVKGAAPKPTDFSDQYIDVGNVRLPAFVDGNDLIARCNDSVAPGEYPVTVNGAELGRIVVDAQ